SAGASGPLKVVSRFGAACASIVRLRMAQYLRGRDGCFSADDRDGGPLPGGPPATADVCRVADALRRRAPGIGATAGRSPTPSPPAPSARRDVRIPLHAMRTVAVDEEVRAVIYAGARRNRRCPTRRQCAPRPVEVLPYVLGDRTSDVSNRLVDLA